MERKVNLHTISDGRLYQSDDLVRLDAGGCVGCSACCRVTGDTIVLDPYDLYQLEALLSADFDRLLATCLELRLVDGLILPNLKMISDDDGVHCAFLSPEGRCQIHTARPGFCILFPLARLYDGTGFSYVLQTEECPRPGKSKVRITKWLGVPDYPRYEAFLNQWHYFLKPYQDYLLSGNADLLWQKRVSMELLQSFFVKPYRTDMDFYKQFALRLSIASRKLPIPTPKESI